MWKIESMQKITPHISKKYGVLYIDILQKLQVYHISFSILTFLSATKKQFLTITTVKLVFDYQKVL